MEDQLAQAALDYHRYPTPGKIAVTPTKAHDATSATWRWPTRPGVAVALPGDRRTIRLTAYDYTARGNLVAVITNGTAVLGLGNIGPLAGKPVMEGKGCLFKKFAGIDVFDIELDETDPDKLVDIIAALEPTFGGINLEDIKAPECFYIETQAARADEDPGLPRRPARHRDHRRRGAAQRRSSWSASRSRTSSWSCSGAGAAAIACLDLLVGLGVRRENIWVTDSKGVVYEGRAEAMDAAEGALRAGHRAPARWPTSMRGRRRVPRLLDGRRAEARDGARRWPTRPIILALANPEPEIRPELAKAGAARLHHRHRPLGLPEPGQQRPVLPVHLPRRARRAAPPRSPRR